jgi:hypothetical protein
MKATTPYDSSRRGTRALQLIAFALAATAVLALAAALCWPLEDAPQGSQRPPTDLAGLDESPCEVAPLVAKMAGRTLVKPVQVVPPAVLNDGAAAAAVKRLKLQGVIQMGDEMVAYVAVQGEGVVTCRKGEKLLEFLVEDIQAGKVVLNLAGVQTTLSH